MTAALGLARYEVALEILGLMIALRARDIADEAASLTPDLAKIARLEADQSTFAAEIGNLLPGDLVAVEHALSVYGPIVRASLSASPAPG